MDRKRRPAISIEGAAGRQGGPGGTGRKAMSARSIGELAGSLMRDVIKRRDASR